MIAARQIFLGRGGGGGIPYVMTSAPEGTSGFRVPWANGTDTGFKIELGIYIPSSSSTVDGGRGYLYAVNNSIGYRIFSLTFDSSEAKTGFSIDTDTQDSGRRTVWQGTWWSSTNLGDYRGVPCHITYNNSTRGGSFSYGDSTYSAPASQGTRSAEYPSEVYILNGVPGSYEHGLLYIRYIAGNGLVLHEYVPVKSTGGLAKLKDTVTGIIYDASTLSLFTYGELSS